MAFFVGNPIDLNFLVNFNQELENMYNQRKIRLEFRTIRDTGNPFEMPDRMFIKLFRLNKLAVHNLIVELEEFVDQPIRRDAVPFHLKVFACLIFFAHGSYQTVVGEDLNLAMSQPTISRVINEISRIFTIYLLPRYVRFPSNDREVRKIKERFFQKHNFPNVLGAIDCTHVAIVSPKVDDPINPAVAYLNRKGYHSINVQAIFDADLLLLNVNARYPGATHDSAIWESSTIFNHLRRRYENGRTNTWLLGDSGYPLQPWLMTPIQDAQPNTPEATYTSYHCRTRNVAERGFGVWKARFKCIKKDRVLHYSHGTAGQIIYSCAVLHNICRKYNIPDEDLNFDDSDDENAGGNYDMIENNIDLLTTGRLIRRGLVAHMANIINA